MNTNSNYLEMIVLAYITGQEVFNRKIYESINDLILELKNFDFSDVLQSASKINYLLSDEYFKKKSPTQIQIAKQLFGNDLKVFNKIKKLWGEDRIIFSRQQLLSIIKINLEYNDNNTGSKKIEDDFFGFGKILLGISDFLEENISDNREIIIGTIFKNIYFNSEQRLLHLLQRYFYIYSEIYDKVRAFHPGEIFDFNNEFKNIYGIDILSFLYFCYGILAHYLDENKDSDLKDFYISNKFFDKVRDEIKNNLKALFSNLSLDKEFFNLSISNAKNYFFSFDFFWSHPLFKMDNGNYFLLDFKFLVEKSTIGIYWMIFDSLKEDLTKNNDNKNECEIKINKLKSFFGRCLEYYVYELFKRVYTRGSLCKSYYSEYNGDNTGNVDLILDYGDTLFFFEITASNITYNCAISGDYERIFKEIDLIFFGDKNTEKKGKIEQLNESINNFIENKLSINAIPSSRIKKIYPVMILQNAFPQAPGLNDEYRKRILKEGYLQNYFNDFVIMDLEELEYSLDLVYSENISLAGLFLEYKESNYRDQSLKNFYYYEGYLKRLKNNQNKITSKIFKNFHLSALNYLFSKDILEEQKEV